MTGHNFYHKEKSHYPTQWVWLVGTAWQPWSICCSLGHRFFLSFFLLIFIKLNPCSTLCCHRVTGISNRTSPPLCLRVSQLSSEINNWWPFSFHVVSQLTVREKEGLERRNWGVRFSFPQLSWIILSVIPPFLPTAALMIGCHSALLFQTTLFLSLCGLFFLCPYPFFILLPSHSIVSLCHPPQLLHADNEMRCPS